MENQITVVIIEDNLESRIYLESIFENELPFVRLLGTTTSINAGIQLINHANPDVIFLDIQLDDGYAFDILDQIDTSLHEIVFVTGLNQYYQKAFEHFAMSYITKPYTPYEIVRVINRVKSKRQRVVSKDEQLAFSKFITNSDTQFLLHLGNEHINIRLSEVIQCVSEGNYTRFFMHNNQEYLASNVLKYYEQLFSQKGFVRVNRSTIINISHIAKIYKKESLTMSNGEKIFISSVYSKKFGKVANVW